MHTKRWLRAIGSAVLAVAGTACTTAQLPATSEESADLVAPIVAANGALNERAAERLVESRLGPRQDDPHIAELVDAFRRSARAPLVAGNRVTVLVDGPETFSAIRDAILHAKHHVHVETYTFSDDAVGREFRDLLVRRQQGGIQVRLLYDAVGSLATPDEMLLNSYLACLAIERRRTARRSVRICEQRYALLHAKTAVIDTALSMIGSANLDMRSFLHNNEVNAVVTGADFARRVGRLFERDLVDSRGLTLDEWRDRPLTDRLKELASSLFSYWP